MIKDIKLAISYIKINIMSTLIFIICLIGIYIAYDGKLQEGIIIIGLVLLLRLPFPLEINDQPNSPTLEQVVDK